MPRAKKTEEEVEPTAETAPPTERDILEDILGDGPDLADEDDDDDDVLEDVPATAEGKASAVRLIDLLVEKKALALHSKPSPKFIEAVARALEWPGPIGRRASKLSDTIVDSEDVDELFVDDDTLAEILKRW